MKKVAIFCPSTVPWIPDFLDGFRSYAAEECDWHIVGMPPSQSGYEDSGIALRSMKGWNGDGIVISTDNIHELRYAKRMKIPVINLGGGLASNYGVPRIMTDHYAAGQQAAEHMIERGLLNLAYFGWENRWYSQQRCSGFQDYAEKSGATCHILLRPTGEDISLSWASRIALITKWLSKLPLPCGVFVVQDYRALLLIEACHECGLRVPDDIAVVGMDNDEHICEHTAPKLSSVPRNAFEMGVEAASTLERMMMNKLTTCVDILIPPTGVVVRESSDMMYCSDPLVRQAIEYMRKNLSRNFNIENVADELGISKRKLEMRFSEATDNSPYQYLTRLRVYHAQALIKLNPEKSMETIAYECGFSTNPTFYAAFRRIIGQTPSSFRN